jgi:hypothetical protein
MVRILEMSEVDVLSFHATVNVNAIQTFAWNNFVGRIYMERKYQSEGNSY